MYKYRPNNVIIKLLHYVDTYICFIMENGIKTATYRTYQLRTIASNLICAWIRNQKSCRSSIFNCMKGQSNRILQVIPFGSKEGQETAPIFSFFGPHLFWKEMCNNISLMQLHSSQNLLGALYLPISVNAAIKTTFVGADLIYDISGLH